MTEIVIGGNLLDDDSICGNCAFIQTVIETKDNCVCCKVVSHYCREKKCYLDNREGTCEHFVRASEVNE